MNPTSSKDQPCSYCQSRRQFLGGGLTLGMGLLLPAGAIAAPAKAQGGRFRHFSGEVFVDGARANARTRVNPDSLVEVKGDSTASLVIGDNAFQLKPDTRVQFTRPTVKTASISGFRLLTGALLGVFGPGKKTLVTNTATIGIRGTGVYFENREDSSYVCLCYGAIDLSGNATPGVSQAMAAKHHAGRSIAAAGEIAEAPMVNHTDDDLQELEALVGRKPPFTV